MADGLRSTIFAPDIIDLTISGTNLSSDQSPPPMTFLALTVDTEGEYVPAYIAGCDTIGGNDIYVPAKSIEKGWDLKYIVFHELLHSAFCLPHIEGSALMNGQTFETISNEETEKLFLQHVQESGKI